MQWYISIPLFFWGLIAHAQMKRSDAMLHDISWKHSQEIPCLNGTRAWHWTISAILSTHTILLSCKMQFNIAPHYLQLLPNSLFSCILPNEILYTFYPPPHTCFTSQSSHPLWFKQTNLITWREQIMNFIIKSLSPKSQCFLQTLYFGSTLCILIYYFF